MAKKSITKQFMFLFRGGSDPAELSRQEMQQVMDRWYTWMGNLKKRGQLTLGHPLDDGGKVLSGKKGKEVKPFAEKRDSVGGYLLVQAKSLSQAARIAQGCPIFERGG